MTRARTVAVSAARTNRTGRTVTVTVPGGPLHIDWREDGHVVMTGPAEWEFSGTFDPATGGWARDLLRNLMVLSAMTPAQMQAAPEAFDTLAGSRRRIAPVVAEDGTVELAQYNVKATGHVAKLRRDLGLAPA